MKMGGRRFNPGCLLRSTLAVCGVVFLPIAVWFFHNWFVHRDQWRQAVQAVVLVAVSIVFLRLAFTRNEGSWMSAIDDL
jgi:hypothetical protein